MAFTAKSLDAYSDLVVKVGLNLRAGQRLIIIGPLANGGASLEAAPLIRRIAVSAYRAGAPLVEVLWGDEELLLLRFQHAPARFVRTVFRVAAPHASRTCPARPRRALRLRKRSRPLEGSEPGSDYRGPAGDVARGAGVPRTDFAQPDQLDRRRRRWGALGGEGVCRCAARAAGSPCCGTRSDASAASTTTIRSPPGKRHLAELAARRDFLNAKRYTALKYTGPGTALTIGLPEGHAWVAGRSFSQSGIEFAPNLPTEEVFTIAHRDHVEGTVRSTKPLSYGGTLIEGFALRFENGRVVNSSAERGADVLRQLIETDDGAGGSARWRSCRTARRSRNRAACSTTRCSTRTRPATWRSGRRTSSRSTAARRWTTTRSSRAGGNRSAVHVDFMIGSGELDIDGVLPAGTPEPLMRRGEWTVERG